MADLRYKRIKSFRNFRSYLFMMTVGNYYKPYSLKYLLY